MRLFALWRLDHIGGQRWLDQTLGHPHREVSPSTARAHRLGDPGASNCRRSLAGTLRGHTRAIRVCMWPADVVSASEDGAVTIWDAEAAALGPSLRHDGPVTACTLAGDGRPIASGSEGQFVRVWGAQPDAAWPSTGQALRFGACRGSPAEAAWRSETLRAGSIC